MTFEEWLRALSDEDRAAAVYTPFVFARKVWLAGRESMKADAVEEIDAILCVGEEKYLAAVKAIEP
jgi:hypothetical protein